MKTLNGPAPILMTAGASPLKSMENPVPANAPAHAQWKRASSAPYTGCMRNMGWPSSTLRYNQYLSYNCHPNRPSKSIPTIKSIFTTYFEVLTCF